MRFLPGTLFMLLLVTSCSKPVKGPNGVTYKSAVQYNDYIISRQSKLMKNVLDFGNTADMNLDSAEAILKRSASQATAMIEELKGMPPYKGDSALRDAAVRSFSFYKKVFEEDYMQMLAISRKGADMSEEDKTGLNDIVEKITREEEVNDKRLHQAQENFAKSNHMKLTENKMQKQFEEK